MVSDGYRESTASWREMLLDLRRRGLLAGPRLATADGACPHTLPATPSRTPAHAGADLLVPQGGQRRGQDAEVGAEQSQDDDP